MSAALTIRDRGLAQLREHLVQLRRLRVRGGVQGAKALEIHPTADVSFGLLAAVHEYGTDDGHIPARPYLRMTLELSRDPIRELLRGAVSDVVDARHSPAAAMAEVGRGLVVEIRKTIDRASSWAVPLAPITVKLKGHDRPLVDTFELRDANTWTVVDGDRVLEAGD